MSLEDRVTRLERRLAVYDLIARYGPAVDSGSADETAALWSEAGSYDFGDGVLEGRDGVAAMVSGPHHQGLIGHGAAHMLGLPLIALDDDATRATVTGYSQVCRHTPEGFEIWRVSANRWELSWTGHAWQVESRQAYVLDGREAARLLLRRGVAGTGAA